MRWGLNSRHRYFQWPKLTKNGRMLIEPGTGWYSNVVKICSNRRKTYAKLMPGMGLES